MNAIVRSKSARVFFLISIVAAMPSLAVERAVLLNNGNGLVLTLQLGMLLTALSGTISSMGTMKLVLVGKPVVQLTSRGLP